MMKLLAAERERSGRRWLPIVVCSRLLECPIVLVAVLCIPLGNVTVWKAGHVPPDYSSWTPRLWYLFFEKHSSVLREE
jgi:hypothetical protein